MGASQETVRYAMCEKRGKAMIMIFNRKELIVTASMKKQEEVREVLSKNHIPYEVKTVNRSSGSALGGRTRAVTGTFGEKPEFMYEYILYVKKEDYEEAVSLIRK